MGSQKDPSEGGEPEDLPSDFFDDFNKDEFMQGLSVVDSWDDDETGKRRIDAEAVDSVKDLRELIDGKDDDRYMKSRGDSIKFDKKYKWQKGNERDSGSEHRRSGSRSKLDEFFKPGSRRDPSKTNEAIKRDKEVKVKELLAKRLDDDLLPPGTELDDYFSEGKPPERRRSQPGEEPLPPRRRSKDFQRHHKVSPLRYRRSPHFSNIRRSPRPEYHRRSPYRKIRQYSPPRKFRRYSPQRHSPRRSSPMRRSPRRNSPRRSPRRMRRSRSPYRSYEGRRSPSPKSYQRDTFLYPNEPSGYAPPSTPYPEGPYPVSTEYSGGPPGYSYPQGQPYAGGYAPGYEYGGPQQMTNIPQPVPAPSAVAPMPIDTAAISTSLMDAALVNNPAPAMVPPPNQIIPSTTTTNKTQISQPYDALAQLVADGKLSQQDYLKLAPNKGVSNTLDTKTRVTVLNRCSQALGKLTKLLLPNRLMIHHSMLGAEPKHIAPKYCSPLKRQSTVEFEFTKETEPTMQQNKQLVDSIIATIGLDKVVARPKKKQSKDMKDAAVQTTKPFCEVCEVRESINHFNASTSIDPEHFCSSIHTQVVEQDLMNSKSIFNPTGSAVDSAPISIAHMTPAQLVSQLAARAKTLKQTSEPSPPAGNQWRHPPSYGNSGGGNYNKYDNYNNYRY